MRGCTFWIGVFASMALVGAGWAEPDTADTPIQLTVELSDGCRLIGVPAITSTPVVTAVGKITVPLAQVAKMTFHDDHEGITVGLVNGDRLTGVHNLGDLRMKTLFGDVTIDPALICQIDCRVGRTQARLPASLRKGMVLYYSFDRNEGDAVTDESSKENHGTVRGPRFTPEGKSGGALSFDGVDDYLDAGNPPSLQLTANFTLCAWIRPERTQDSFGIITKSQGYPEQDRRGIEFMLGHDDTLSAYFWDESTRYFSGVVKNKTIQRQEWTHVALLHDSALPEHQMRAFINGVPCEMNYGYETVSSIPVVRNVAEPVRIGCMRPGVHHFKGRIDDVMIFSRTLSAEEIQTLYGIRK